jgi:hypothetical protein
MTAEPAAAPELTLTDEVFVVFFVLSLVPVPEAVPVPVPLASVPVPEVVPEEDVFVWPAVLSSVASAASAVVVAAAEDAVSVADVEDAVYIVSKLASFSQDRHRSNTVLV